MKLLTNKEGDNNFRQTEKYIENQTNKYLYSKKTDRQENKRKWVSVWVSECVGVWVSELITGKKEEQNVIIDQVIVHIHVVTDDQKFYTRKRNNFAIIIQKKEV